MDDARLMAIRIAGAGYAEGEPGRVLKWPVDMVFDVAAVLKFQGEYDATRYVLNEPKK